MAITAPLRNRKMLFQNASSGKIWEVTFTRSSAGAVSGVGRLQGTNLVGGSPDHANTEVSFVVLTSHVAKIIGTAPKHDSALAYAAYYDASDVGGAGAALSTLLS